MLAVLPFENLGDPEDEYFADGMTEEITARLAVVHDLGVIARTSAIQYKKTDKSILQIGEELGVDYILEGTIRWQKGDESSGRIRVTPQLIKVSDATHVWAEIYDEVITQVFDVQTDIAEKVVEQLNIVLVASEQDAISAKPTDNLRAYDLYTRGWEYRDRFMGEDDLLRAQDLFEQAIALDSNFMAAYGSLSMVHSLLYWYGYDHTPERAEKAKRVADLAARRDPEDHWVQFALGYYFYYGVRDYDRALMHFRRVLDAVPNQPEALSATANVLRRQGEFEQAAQLQRRAVELDPLAFSVRLNFAGTLERLRRFDEELTLLEEMVRLYPDNVLAVAYLAYVHAGARGDVESARTVLQEASGQQDSTVFYWMYWLMAVIERDFETAISIDPFGMDTAQATDSADFYLGRANALHWGGYEAESKVYYDSARIILERLDVEDIIANAWSWPSLGRAYAGLGRKEDAIRAGRELVEYVPLSEDAMAGTSPLTDLAKIYARVGEPELALDLLDSLLSIPSLVTATDLKINPEWDPIRDHPRFQALIAKYE
jgi:serine/threonine-protein kinase